MRGKLLSLALIATMFSAFFVGLGHGQTPITVSVDPALVTGLYGGDSFELNIFLTGGEAIYAWEFGLRYPQFVQQIAVIEVVEGPYLESAEIMPDGTYMTYYKDGFNGFVSASGTLLGDSMGAYGDGVLATIRFTIIEPVGEYPLDLLYVRLFVRFDSELIEIDPLDITLVDGYFLGPIADLDKNPGEDRVGKGVWQVGKPRRFHSIVDNTGYAPVWARARYTSVRDDGRRVTVYSGQHLFTTQPRATEYYYVNGFTPVWTRWTTTGASPWLNAADGTNYITGTAYSQIMGLFDFADITLNPGDIIYRVTLEGRTRAASTLIDYDVYDTSFNWYGSLWGSAAWTWRGLRNVAATDTIDALNPAVRTQAGFNSFQLLLHYWTPEGNDLGPADLDAMRLRVEYIGIDPINVLGDVIPSMTLKTLDRAVWDLWPFDMGTYTTTVTMQYKSVQPDPRFAQYWATGANIETFTWTVYP